MIFGATGCQTSPTHDATERSSAEHPLAPPPTGAGGSAAFDAASATAAAGRSDRPIEVLSWWTRAGDEDALGKLIALHHRAHPEDVVIDGTVAHSGQARRTIGTRLLRGDPPDAFQANVGSDLMQWVFLNGVDAHESRLSPLDEPEAALTLFRQQVPTQVLAGATYRGKLYGLPTNIERVNSFYCNKKVFDRLHLSPPTSFAELVTVSQRLRSAGITPLTMGTQQPWTAVLLVFECLLTAREGPRFYQDYFAGRLAADDPRITRTLEEALRLLPFINADHGQLTWIQAAEALMSGRAGMMAMGDWSRLLFKVNGWALDRDYLEVPFPGTSSFMIFTSDTFALPLDARNKAGARRLLASMASTEGQRTLSEAKSQLPARLDAARSATTDATIREKLNLVEQGALFLALSGTTPQRFSDDLADAVTEMFATRDIEPVIQTLRSRYPLLKQ